MYILDTCILRYYLTQPQNYPYMTAQIDRADWQHLLCLTIVNAQELIAWRLHDIKDRPDQRQGVLLQLYGRLSEVINIIKRFEVLPINEAAYERFLALAHLQTAIGTRDRRIASIALAHDATVVTNNEQDFRLVPGLRVENWARTTT